MDIDSAAASASGTNGPTKKASGGPIGTAVDVGDPPSRTFHLHPEAQSTCARCDELDKVRVGMFIECISPTNCSIARARIVVRLGSLA